MRHYTAALNLVSAHCTYLSSWAKSGKKYKMGLSYSEVLQIIETEDNSTLKDWISEIEEWRGALTINGVNKYNKLNGINIVLGAIRATIRNRVIYDILESN